ncbi:MAG TPA: response regulator transcription factor [Acetobacteraceae bacterium]
MSHPKAGLRLGSQARLNDAPLVTSDALIVVERREFARGCLSCWITNYCGGIAVVPVGDAESELPADAFGRCIAAIIAVEPSEQYLWLRRQIAWLRERQPRFPIILITGSDQCTPVADLAIQLGLQGYIPASCSLEVAAAAVQLVIAGGSYFPRPPTEASQEEFASHHAYSVADLTRTIALTSRERSVLALLSDGLPNKVIAKRLSMSLSTVKAHVHHIIRKLKVGNRTEVAILAQHLSPGITETAATATPPIESSRHERDDG